MTINVANQNIRYSFHENYQPIIVFAISSSNKIVLNVFVNICTAILDSDIGEETLMCNVSTVFKLFPFF